MRINYFLGVPSLWPNTAIGSPDSRLHVIVGVGDPLAAHFNVTLLPSLTTISLLVRDSMITGGTITQNNIYNTKKLCKLLKYAYQQLEGIPFWNALDLY